LRSDRPRAAQQPLRLNAPFYIVGEGAGDAAFIDELLKSRGVANGAFQVGEAEGYTEFQRHLEALSISSDRHKLTSLALVADNDLDPPGRFANVQTALTNAGLPVPATPLVVIPGPPAVGVFMMPNDGTNGNLETMLDDAIVLGRPHIDPCLQQFAACVNAPGVWGVNKTSKMRVNATIAAWCLDDPGSSLAYIWNKPSNPIPLASPRFNALVDFLRAIGGV
jgi:hypothetical protein